MGRFRSTRRRLVQVAEKGSAQLPAAPALSCQPQPGTVLIREWHGVAHHVTVLEHGVRYGGEHYRSLSQVARLITERALLQYAKENGINYTTTAPFFAANGRGYDPQGSCRLSSITDGTSNTIFSAHRYAICTTATWTTGGTAWAYGALSSPALPAPMPR